MKGNLATALVDEKEPQPAQNTTEQTLDAFLKLWATRTPNALALADAPNRSEFAIGQAKSFTFAEVYEISGQLAKQFREHGLNPGHILAIQLPNIVELPILVLAALRAGLIACPFPFLWRRYEIEQALRQIPARAFMTVGDFDGFSHSEMMCELAFDNLGVRFIYGVGPKQADGVTSLDYFFNKDTMRPPQNDEEHNLHTSQLDNPALITWSMRPGLGLQPIYRNHRELIASGLMHVLELGLNPSDRLLNPYPLTGLIGLAGIFVPSLLIGASVVQHHPFNYNAFVEQMHNEKVNYAAAPAAVLQTLQQDNVLSQVQDHLRSFGCVWQIPHEKQVDRKSVGSLPMPIYDIRNLHETAIYISKRDENTPKGEIKLGDFRSKDPDGKEMRLFETRFKGRMRSGQSKNSGTSSQSHRFSGTLFVRGVSVPKGSGIEAQEKKKGIFASYDDWVNTGIQCYVGHDSTRMDRVCCEADENVLYHGGTMIFADELDKIYGGFDGFSDAAVFTYPDPVLGQRLFAAIVPENPQMFQKKDFDNYLSHLGIAPYKFPEQLIIVDKIPKNNDNKVLREEIINTHLETIAGN